ncbi:MAG: ankyrin repeat domain-containing protein [Verrucomicrobia bacterium]|nr:ankyrin repeat domain-containing protein [Verrucomicrobiota bacterium]
MKSRFQLFAAIVVLLAASTAMCEEKYGNFSVSDLQRFWKEMWKLGMGGKQLEEPKVANLTDADAVHRLTGTWVRMEAEHGDDVCMLKRRYQLNADHTFDVSCDPEPGKKRRNASGKWRVVSNKIVELPDETAPLPGYMFMVGKKFYVLDGAMEMRELKREKDLLIGKLTWEPWTGQVHKESPSSPEKVEGRCGKVLDELYPGRPEMVPVTVFVTAKGKVWAGPEQNFYVETDQGVFGSKPPRGGGSWIVWCDSLLAQRGDEKCTMDKALDRFEKEVDVFTLNRAWWFGSQDTDMSRLLFKPPFINFKTENSTKVKMLRIQVGRGEMQLDMRSPNERYTASATIDIKSKKLLKAVLHKTGAIGETESPLSTEMTMRQKVEKAGAVPVAPPSPQPHTVALLAKENQKKWKIEAGEWKFENGVLIGSGPSEIVYQEDLTPPFTLQFEIKVLKGMRPRVKYGRFKFANESFERTFGIYPAPKNAPLFHYELKTSYRVSLSIGLDAVELYVNGSLISKAPGVKDQPAQLKFYAGDNWSKGEVEYKNIIVTQTAKPSPPLAQRNEREKPAGIVAPAKTARAPTKKQPHGDAPEPVVAPIIVPGEHKEWQSVLILSNDVLRVRLRYMPIFSAADPFPMALEFDNRSGGPLKVQQTWVQFKTSRRDVEKPHVSVPWETVPLPELTNGVTIVTGRALWSPLFAAKELTPNASIRVPVTTGGDVWLQDGRRYYFDRVPFTFEMRHPTPAAIESMKQQLREGLRAEEKTDTRHRRKPTVILSDGTPAMLDRASAADSIDRLEFLAMKEIADAMTLDDLLTGLKTHKRYRASIAQFLARRFPNAPEVLAYYREELAKERTDAWDDALMVEVWNDEFLKAAVARFEKGDLRWGYSILERHRKEWIGKPDYVARISAAQLKQRPILTSRPEKLLDHELYGWSRAVSEAGATGDRQFIKYLAPALDDRRVIQEPESQMVRAFATRICDCALNAILMILDGDTWKAFNKAGIEGWHDVERVKGLIAARADVNAQDPKGETPLIAALQNVDEEDKNSVEVVRSLLKAGADARSKNAKGETALMLALGVPELVPELLKKGADVNAVDKRNATALMLSLGNHLQHPPPKKDRQIVTDLLAAGANVNAKNNAGETPLFLACENGDAALVQLLLEKGAKVKDREGDYALEEAAALDKIDVMRLLLRSGANANALARHEREKTVLMQTSQRRSVERVALLLEHGADINTRQSNTGFTALIWAAWAKNNAAVVKYLLEKGAKPNAQTTLGNTALMMAAGDGHNENVQALLVGGADPNIKNNKGETALMWATRSRHADTVAILQKAGAKE